jgi:hypothetical protein
MTKNISASFSSTPPERNFFGKLANGDFGLSRTYWLFGVLPAIGVNLLSNFAVTSVGGLFLLTLSYGAYDIFVIMGVWRAAKRYDGPRLWVYMAKAFMILGAIGLTVSLGMLSYLLLQS